MLQWILEETIPRRSTIEEIVGRLMIVNFAAIHTSSNVSINYFIVVVVVAVIFGGLIFGNCIQTLSTALLYLAAAPKYLGPLREEVESVIDKEGWGKSSMQKMRKVDSFLRETLRCRGVEPCMYKSPETLQLVNTIADKWIQYR